MVPPADSAGASAHLLLEARRDARPRGAAGRFLPLATAASGASRVLYVTSEMGDFLKAGELGDVAAALPRALRASVDIRVLIPGYPTVMRAVEGLRFVGRTAEHAGLPACAIAEATLADRLRVLVLVNSELYAREGSPYVDHAGVDWSDNAVRFATLAHAAAEIAGGRAGMAWRADILHVNDWPGALAPVYVAAAGDHTPTLLTVHNLAYQGLFDAGIGEDIGVPAAMRESMAFHGRLSFLRGGLVHASHVNTVSATYAWEITTDAHGCGLDALLRRIAARGGLSGIANGIDDGWDPRTDPHLHARFGVGEWQGRRANARQVRREFSLPDGTGPLFAVVSRLVHQKGVDLVTRIAPQLAQAGGQLVVIGHGEPAYEGELAALARRHPGHIGVHAGFDERLSRRMFAGADFLLMPSRFEPCGLSQMYAQAFGCLPIVTTTGGLVDTVEDGVTGFHVGDAGADALRRGVQRAFRAWRYPRLLEAMRRAAMLSARGWDAPAADYAARYRQLAGPAPVTTTGRAAA